MKHFFDFRMESISIRSVHGMAKVLGSAVSVSGALVFAFVKGPSLKFMMNWYQTSHDHQNHYRVHSDSLSKSYHKGNWIKGSLMMLSANTAWSLWLILQVLFTLFSSSVFIFDFLSLYNIIFILFSLTLFFFLKKKITTCYNMGHSIHKN